MLFLGTFEYAMDERGRVPLPPKFRDAFRAGIVLGQGSPDRCVKAYTQDAFAQQAEQYMSLSAFSRKGRDLQRIMFSRTFDTQLDPQNRVLIPPWLREFAGLGNRVLVVGSGGRIEFWSPERYGFDIERIESALEATLESIEERQTS